jgi:hypothetical protein
MVVGCYLSRLHCFWQKPLSGSADNKNPAFQGDQKIIQQVHLTNKKYTCNEIIIINC